jgi:hypothetical protein
MRAELLAQTFKLALATRTQRIGQPLRARIEFGGAIQQLFLLGKTLRTHVWRTACNKRSVFATRLR